MLKSIAAFIIKILAEIFFNKTKESVESWLEEKRAKAADDKTAKEAVEEVRRPIDPTKTKEQRDKDAEDAFDRFHDRLS